MTTPRNSWEAADKAYLTHHFACPQCCAAGVLPGRQERCHAGQTLWTQYLNAGTPPHFTWINQPKVRGKNPF